MSINAPQSIRPEPLKSWRWGAWLALLALALLALAALPGGCRQSPSPKAEPQAPPIAFTRVSDDAVRHGERVARVLGCLGCHGEDLTGLDWSEPGFGRLWTANLTRAVARYDDAQLARVIISGVRPDGRELWAMPSHLFTQLAAPDMAALLAFLRSRPLAGPDHPAPTFEAGARREIAAGRLKPSPVQVREEGRARPPAAPGRHELARYIVRATCAECHGMDLRGGQPNPEAQRRADLRMVGAYTREDFRHLLRTGLAAGNREVGLMSEVARGRYRHLTDGEVDAIYDYLRALGVDL